MKLNLLFGACGWGLILLLGVCMALVSCKKNSSTNHPPEYFFKNPKVVELCNAISNKDEPKVDNLLNQGIDINTIGKDGMTPLLWAFNSNDKNIYEMVLKKGADPNIKITARGWKNSSVMSLVCLMDDSDYLEITLKYIKRVKSEKISPNALKDAIDVLSLEKVKLLVAAGADINQPDTSGCTPLINAGAINQFHIVYYLLQAGADPLKPDSSGLTLVYLIEESNQLMSRKGEHYQYLLKCAEFLKNKGIEVDVSKPQKYPEK